MYTEEINKIALSNNDDKRLQTFGKVTTYPYESNAFKVCESKMMIVKNTKTQSRLAVYSRSSIQNINNKRFMIWKDKCIIKSNKQPTRY